MKSRWMVVMMLVGLTAWSGSETLLVKARNLEKRGAYAKAATAYRELYDSDENDPQRVTYLVREADCHLRASNAEDAIEVYKTILESHGDKVREQLTTGGMIARILESQEDAFIESRRASAADARKVRARLRRIILKDVSLKGLPLDQAMGKLLELGAKADTDHAPFKAMILHDRPKVVDRESNGVVVGNVDHYRFLEDTAGRLMIVKTDLPAVEDVFPDDEEPGPEAFKLPKVSLEFDEMSLESALDLLCQSIFYRIEIRGKRLVAIPRRYTTEKLYLEVMPLSERYEMNDAAEDVLSSIDYTLPVSSSGLQSFLRVTDDGNEGCLMMSFNTRANNRKMRDLALSLEQAKYPTIDVSITLMAVKADHLPAFVTLKHLAKIPKSDKTTLTSISLSAKSGTVSEASLMVGRPHNLTVLPTLSSDRQAVNLDLTWNFATSAKDVESQIKSSFKVRSDRGRVLKLGTENGRRLLAVVNVKTPPKPPVDMAIVSKWAKSTRMKLLQEADNGDMIIIE